WVVGQTNRFAAAVSQRDIASWGAWWYTADFTLFQPSWFKAPPFEDEQDFKARSPLTYIKNVKTRSEEHTSELQSRSDLVCRLLLPSPPRSTLFPYTTLFRSWVVGQTNRFAAAVSQRDIASWGAWWYTADFTLLQPSWFKAPPFEDEQDFKARSPLTYIKNVKT